MSDTPRTDVYLRGSTVTEPEEYDVLYQHALALERELSAAQQRIAVLERAVNDMDALMSSDCVCVPRESLRRWRTAFPVLRSILQHAGLSDSPDIARSMLDEIDSLLSSAQEAPDATPPR